MSKSFRSLAFVGATLLQLATLTAEAQNRWNPRPRHDRNHQPRRNQSFSDHSRRDLLDDQRWRYDFQYYPARQCRHQSLSRQWSQYEPLRPRRVNRSAVTLCNSFDRGPAHQSACGYCVQKYNLTRPSFPSNNSQIDQAVRATLRACIFGVMAAEDTAKKHEPGRAREDGFLSGYSCGLDMGLEQPQEVAYNDGEQAFADDFYAGEYNREFDIAIERVVQSADGAASSQATDSVYNRFKQAVTPSGGQLPSSTPENPESYIRYQGESDGFSFLGYRLPAEAEIIDDLEADEIDLYGNADAFRDSWYSSGTRYRHADIYRRRNQYRNSGYDHWIDRDGPTFSNRAFSQWKRNGQRNSRRFYEGLAEDAYVVRVAENGQVTPSPEGPGQRGGGRSGGRRGDQPAQPTPEPPQEGQPTEAYQEFDFEAPKSIFETEFREAYKFYGLRVYRYTYRVSLDDGYQSGFDIGQEAAAVRSHGQGYRAALNNEFAEASRQAYRDRYRSAFAQAFSSAYQRLENGAFLDAYSLHKMVGELDDGIIQPGECSRLDASVRNYGGQPVDVTLNKAGQINQEVSAEPLHEQQVKALQRASLQTGYVFCSPQNIIPGDRSSYRASLDVVLQGGRSSLSKSIQYVLQNPYAMTENQTTQTRFFDGQLALDIQVSNPRSTPSSEQAEVHFYNNNQLILKQSLPQLASYQRKDLQLVHQFSSPLAILGNVHDLKNTQQSYVLRTELKVDDRIMQANEAKVVQFDVEKSLIKYAVNLGVGRAQMDGQSSEQAAHKIITEVIMNRFYQEIAELKTKLSQISRSDLEDKKVLDGYFINRSVDDDGEFFDMASQAWHVIRGLNQRTERTDDVKRVFAKISTYFQGPGVCALRQMFDQLEQEQTVFNVNRLVFSDSRGRQLSDRRQARERESYYKNFVKKFRKEYEDRLQKTDDHIRDELDGEYDDWGAADDMLERFFGDDNLDRHVCPRYYPGHPEYSAHNN